MQQDRRAPFTARAQRRAMRPRRRPHPSAFVLLVAALVTAAGCRSLPKVPDKPVSLAADPPPDTPLVRAVHDAAARHPGLSGFYLLPGDLDALAARAALAGAARETLDVQYYLFQADTTGRLMAQRLLAAADRGVRVRILVDDMDTKGRDANIAALDAHPNVEIRLFNPFVRRGFRLADFLFDMGRVNRRMHNKAFIADNAAAVIGGRNLGDEYFAAGEDAVFFDLDALAVGPVVPAISDSFDIYWNSDWAVPISALTEAPPPEALDAVRDRLDTLERRLAASPYARAVREADLARRLARHDVPLVWAKAEVHYDRPQKVRTASDDPTYHMGPRIRPLVEHAQKDVRLFSAYFIPGKEGVRLFCDRAAAGASVRILTNSLAATDVWAVHGGYAHYREDLVRCGVRLYELKVTAFEPERVESDTLTFETPARLHAKAMVVDDRWVFIGSFNMDPRSALQNTEIGLTIDSPELAAQVIRVFDVALDPRNSWALVPAHDGRPVPPERADALLWAGDEGAGTVLRDGEPDAGFWRKLGAWFAGILPIENQL